MSSCPCSSPEEGPAPGAPPPEGDSFAGLLKRALSKMQGEKQLTEEGVRESWEAIVGGKAASHSRPVSLRRGRLIVNVDSSAWLYELTLQKNEIIGKCVGRFAGKKVKEVQLRIGEVA